MANFFAAHEMVAYTPSGDERVVFWLDATDIATLYQEVGGSVFVTSDGQHIGTWADKSINAWHVSALAEGSKPTYKANQQNGLPSVRFDGTSDSMRTVSASLQGAAYTVFVVARRLSVRPNEAILSIHNEGSLDWNNGSSVCVGYGTETLLADARASVLKSTTSHPGNHVSFIYTTRYDGASNTAFVNGVAASSVASSGQFSAESIALGARSAHLGDLNNYEYFEVLIYEAALSDSDRHEVEDYLGSKYALPGTQWAPPPPPPPEPPAGPYNPTLDSRVTFWLDASDPGTLFLDSNGTTPVTSSGQPIGMWADKSANAWNVMATEGDTGRPTFKTNQQNGKPSVRFDGTSDSLTTASASIEGSSFTIFVVARRISHRPLEAILSIHNEGAPDWNSPASLCLGYSDEFVLADARDYHLMGQAAHPGNGVSFLYGSTYDGVNNMSFINGIPAASVNSSGTFSAETITLGARGASLGDRNNYEYFEVLIFDFALSAAYRQAVEAYFGEKYALPGTQWAPPPPPPPEPPVGPYNPGNDSHTTFWLDSSDQSTLFQDSNASTQVTGDGQLVGTWADKSQNGWHVLASAETNKPTFKANRQNGFPAVRFDGTSDALRTLSASLQGSSYTVFVVARRMSHKPLESILSIHDEGSLDWNNGASVCVGYSDGAMLADCRRSSLVSHAGHPGSGVSFLFTTKYDGTNNTAYVNGIGGAPVSSRGNFGAETITLGARSPNLGDRNNYEYFEVLILDFAVSDAYRHAVEDYFGAKYALPGTQWEPPPPPPPQPPVGPYTPAADSRLVFWLDAADQTTLFQDEGGVNPISADGQSVGAWADKSQNGWHVTAPFGSTSKPTFKADQQNGIGSVRFDGGSDSLRTLSASLQSASYTVFVVSRRISYRNFEALLSIHDEVSPDWNSSSSVCIGYSDGMKLADVRASQIKSQTFHPSAGVTFFYVSKYDGTNNTVYVNGSAGTSVPSASNFDAEGIVLGARGASLTDKNNYEYFEVLIYDFALSDDYREAVEEYLISKYAVENVGSNPPDPGPEFPPQPPGIYTPAGDNRVVFWLDAADSTTLFEDPQGTIPVAYEGQMVGLWLDKSYKAWDVSTDSANNQNKPIFSFNQQGGMPAIRFDGESDYLRTTAASLQGSAYTVFIVSRRIAIRNLETMLSIYDAGGQDWNNNYSVTLGHYVDFQDVHNFLGDCRTDVLLSEMPHPGNDVTFLYASKYDGTYNIAYLNGSPGDPFPSTGNFSAEAILLGARSATLDHFNRYDYFEVLIYDFALSDSYREAVEVYLNTKYSIP